MSSALRTGALISFLMAAGCPLHAFPPPTMVCDIAPGMLSSAPANLVEVGETLFFAAHDGTTGKELWKSDGTEGGTSLVKDVLAGGDSSNPANLTAVGSTLFFTATNASGTVDLWTSDGTEAGTLMLANVQPATYYSLPSNFTAYNGKLYYAAYSTTIGRELFVSDGTVAGTKVVKDIHPDGGGGPGWLTESNGTLFFTIDDGTHGTELWKTDGTEAGTVMVGDLRPGGDDFSPGHLVDVDGTLFFFALNGDANFNQLWKSDGTAAGTVLVKTINPGSYAYPAAMTNVNGTLFFSAHQSGYGNELWKSDGTESGTVMVKDICSGPNPSYPNNLVMVGGFACFIADNGSGNYEVWRSDGTDAGTCMVKEINAAGSAAVALLTVVGDEIFFRANNGTTGPELWRSDGTEAGTKLVHDIYSGSSSSGPAELTAVGDQLFFSATDGINGTELWAFDPTLAEVAVAIAPSPWGTVSPTAGTHTYTIGQSVAVAATADASHLFDGWTTTGEISVAEPATASTTMTVNGDGTVTANFRPYTGSIEGLAWYEEDGDGIREAGEGFHDAEGRATLRDGSGEIVGTAIFYLRYTEAMRRYSFGNLPPGTYTVGIEILYSATDLDISPRDQGDDDALDSDFDPLTGRSAEIVLGADEAITNLDVGFCPEYLLPSGIIYVDIEATGANDGSSWEDAFTRVADAIGATSSEHMIWVAEGTYPTYFYRIYNSSPPDIRIYGGFQGTETDFSQRDALAHPTILTGEIGDPATRDDNYPVLVRIVNQTTSISDLVVDGVTLTRAGGATPASVGAVDCWGTNVTLRNCMFLDNMGYVEGVASGGAVRVRGPAGLPLRLVFDRCLFADNVSANDGAAIYVYGYLPTPSTARISNCVFVRNEAIKGRGGAWFGYACATEFVNCTFLDNQAGIAGDHAAFLGQVHSISNCVAAGDSSGPIALSSAMLTVANSNIEGCGGSGAGWNSACGTDSGGNLDADPEFVDATDPAGPDGTFMTADDGLALKVTSPSLDTGDNTNPPGPDIRGIARPQGAGVDMGAYEQDDFTGPTLLSWTLTEDTGLNTTDLITADDTPELGFIFDEPVRAALADGELTTPGAGTLRADVFAGDNTDTLTFSFTTPLTEDGLHTFTLSGASTVTDRAGNPLNGGADEAVQFTLDITPPLPSDPGVLDVDFDTDGIVALDLQALNYADQAVAVAVQDDGDVVAAGTADTDGTPVFAVWRLADDGSLDPTFGSGGITTVAAAAGGSTAADMALQTDGKIVVAGTGDPGNGNTVFVLLRLTATGAVDSSFGTAGTATVDVGPGADEAVAVGIQDDGKIVVAGTSHNGVDADIAVVRFLPDGSVDPTFGTAGRVVVDLAAADDWVGDIKIKRSGTILVAGCTDNAGVDDAFIVALDASGELDPSFGTDGVATLALAGGARFNGLALHASAKIVAVGSVGTGAGADVLVVRCHADGSLDNSFSGDGIFILDAAGDEDVACDVVVQTNKRITLAGFATEPGGRVVYLVQLTPAGGLTNFGLGGTASFAVAGSPAEAHGMTIDRSGRIVLAGSVDLGTETDALVARLKADRAPKPPRLKASSDTGVSDADGITSDDTPTLEIDVDSAPYFRVYCDDVRISGLYETGAEITCPQLAEGTRELTVTAVNANGAETAPSIPLMVTIDLGTEVTGDGMIAAQHGAEQIWTAASGDDVEPRSCGIRTRLVRFGQPMDTSLTDLALVSVVGVNSGDVSAHVANLQWFGSRELIIHFSPALPDGDTFVVTLDATLLTRSGQSLSGDRSFIVNALVGDVNGDGVVNIGDLLDVRSQTGQALGRTNATRDVNGDGMIDVGDLLNVRGKVDRRLPGR